MLQTIYTALLDYLTDLELSYMARGYENAVPRQGSRFCILPSSSIVLCSIWEKNDGRMNELIAQGPQLGWMSDDSIYTF